MSFVFSGTLWKFINLSHTNNRSVWEMCEGRLFEPLLLHVSILLLFFSSRMNPVNSFSSLHVADLSFLLP